jgi:GNAT superfamily N-acetyltransferase
MRIKFKNEIQNSDKKALETILQNTKFFNNEEVRIALELIDDYLQKKQASDYKFLLAYQNKDDIVGYTCFGLIPGTLNNYDLYWIVVATQAQNKGIGKQLLEKTERILTELGGNKLYAETSGRKQYHPTHQFYLRNNFILEARLKDFYAPNDDKLIFAK